MDISAIDALDEVWDANDEVTSQEWSKMDEDFSNVSHGHLDTKLSLKVVQAGYREGITAGKESALQQGFDDGFANVGAPLGREIGVLRGTASAAMSFLSSSLSRVGVHPETVVFERCKGEVRNIADGLARIHLADLAPRDLHAEEHARERMENETAGEALIKVGPSANGSDPVRAVEYRLAALDGEVSASRPAVEELKRLRVRLSNVLGEVGLDIALA